LAEKSLYMNETFCLKVD